MKLDQVVEKKVAALLGRQPRGLQDVPVLDQCGEPAVIRVASLVDDKPFPTLFWLVAPDLCYRIDQLEACGTIARLQARIDSNTELSAAMAADHRAHIALRLDHMSPEVRRRLEELGYGSVLDNKGIGGIADFSRIRCLHTWYAAHLVVPNTVGGLLEDYWSAPPCSPPL